MHAREKVLLFQAALRWQAQYFVQSAARKDVGPANCTDAFKTKQQLKTNAD